MPFPATLSARPNGGLNRLQLKYFIHAVFTKPCDHGDIAQGLGRLRCAEASSASGGATSAGDLHSSPFTSADFVTE